MPTDKPILAGDGLFLEFATSGGIFGLAEIGAMIFLIDALPLGRTFSAQRGGGNMDTGRVICEGRRSLESSTRYILCVPCCVAVSSRTSA